VPVVAGPSLMVQIIPAVDERDGHPIGVGTVKQSSLSFLTVQGIAELSLASLRAKVDDLCNRRAMLRAVAQGERHAISYRLCNFPPTDSAIDQANARGGDQALRLRVIPDEKNVNAGLAQNVAQVGCLMGLGPNRGAQQWQLRS